MDENDTSILNLERAKNDNDISRTLQSYQDALNKKALEYEKQKKMFYKLKGLTKRI